MSSTPEFDLARWTDAAESLLGQPDSLKALDKHLKQGKLAQQEALMHAWLQQRSEAMRRLTVQYRECHTSLSLGHLLARVLSARCMAGLIEWEQFSFYRRWIKYHPSSFYLSIERALRQDVDLATAKRAMKLIEQFPDLDHVAFPLAALLNGHASLHIELIGWCWKNNMLTAVMAQSARHGFTAAMDVLVDEVVLDDVTEDIAAGIVNHGDRLLPWLQDYFRKAMGENRTHQLARKMISHLAGGKDRSAAMDGLLAAFTGVDRFRLLIDLGEKHPAARPWCIGQLAMIGGLPDQLAQCRGAAQLRSLLAIHEISPLSALPLTDSVKVRKFCLQLAAQSAPSPR